jgi:hypothetical protein
VEPTSGRRRRDPARIDRILGLVQSKRAWTEDGCDDFRLLQLLIAVAQDIQKIPPIPELYYIEDDKLEAALFEWVKQETV